MHVAKNRKTNPPGESERAKGRRKEWGTKPAHAALDEQNPGTKIAKIAILVEDGSCNQTGYHKNNQT